MNDTKQFINSFKFLEPNWTQLPDNFPNLSKKGLTKREGFILDGIKLAWTTSEGRADLYKNGARKLIVVVIIAGSLLLGRNVNFKTNLNFTNSVEAKTVTQSVESLVQATMSAVFKK